MPIGLSKSLKFVKQRIGGSPEHYQIVFVQELSDKLKFGLVFNYEVHKMAFIFLK